MDEAINLLNEDRGFMEGITRRPKAPGASSPLSLQSDLHPIEYLPLNRNWTRFKDPQGWQESGHYGELVFVL
jgi:hypothetical protein